METKEITPKPNLIAFCGLYCANCSKQLKGKCPGCQKNEKASWCKIRSCCMEKNIASCAECQEYIFPNDCKKYNNVFARVIGFVSNTDRSKCIEMIRKEGADKFVLTMTENGKMSFPKSKKTN